MADRPDDPGEFTVSDENLYCPICMGIFQVPKMLIPCLHSFCAKCLRGYLTQGTSVWVSRGSEFKCPVCRGKVSIPSSKSSKVKDSVESFPGNHIIQNLLDARAKSNLKSSIKGPKRSVHATCNVNEPAKYQIVTATTESLNPNQDVETLTKYTEKCLASLRVGAQADDHDADHDLELDQATLERYMTINPAEPRNPVSVFMELSQQLGQGCSFVVRDQAGPSHQPVFRVAAELGTRTFPTVSAGSKNAGKQRAACVAMNVILSEGGKASANLELLIRKSQTMAGDDATPTPAESKLIDRQVAQEVFGRGAAVPIVPGSNPVSTLNEYIQARGRSLKFELISKSGPPHNPVFEMCAVIDGKPLPVVKAHSKKQARVEAALAAIVELNSADFPNTSDACTEPQSDADLPPNALMEALLLKD